MSFISIILGKFSLIEFMAFRMILEFSKIMVNFQGKNWAYKSGKSLEICDF